MDQSSTCLIKQLVLVTIAASARAIELMTSTRRPLPRIRKVEPKRFYMGFKDLPNLVN